VGAARDVVEVGAAQAAFFCDEELPIVQSMFVEEGCEITGSSRPAGTRTADSSSLVSPPLVVGDATGPSLRSGVPSTTVTCGSSATQPATARARARPSPSTHDREYGSSVNQHAAAALASVRKKSGASKRLRGFATGTLGATFLGKGGGALTVGACSMGRHTGSDGGPIRPLRNRRCIGRVTSSGGQCSTGIRTWSERLRVRTGASSVG
jgi:hypothetical protein